MSGQLSKTIQLGVIILALELLAELKLPLPRLVAAAAVALGISRKSGYQARDRLRALLGEARKRSKKEGASRRELLHLRIRVQVLTYERDHAVRFADRSRHLSREARELAVRLLREFKDGLSETEVADELGVPLSSLRRWNEEATEEGEIRSKPEHRGRHRRARPEDVERVLEEYQRLEEPVTLEEFSQEFNEKYPDRTLDRKTITRILLRAGLVEPEVKDRGEPYHGKFRVYFPGAQVALDATRSEVVFTAAPEETITLSEEVVIDIASGTILGKALEREENSDGVERVILQARAECESILAVLSDNGSANRAERIERMAERETEVGQIFSFPYHPQTNGHLEGLFGQFSRIVGKKIALDDSSRESLARSVVEIIWRIFAHFHNYSPRAGLNGLSPLEYLRRYVPKPEEVEEARKGLEKEKERSRDLRRPHLRLSERGFQTLVERIVARHGFEVPLPEALKALVNYDQEVIESSSDAFFVQSARDGFDKRKRTFRYLVGIARNKQKDIDAARLRSRIGTLDGERVRAEGEAARQKLREEEREEAEALRRQPERVILQYAEMLLRGRLRFLRERWLAGLRRGLRALGEIGRATHAMLENLAVTIRSWGEYSEDLKEEMVKLLVSEYQIVRSPEGLDSS